MLSHYSIPCFGTTPRLQPRFFGPRRENRTAPCWRGAAQSSRRNPCAAACSGDPASPAPEIGFPWEGRFAVSCICFAFCRNAEKLTWQGSNEQKELCLKKQKWGFNHKLWVDPRCKGSHDLCQGGPLWVQHMVLSGGSLAFDVESMAMEYSKPYQENKVLQVITCKQNARTSKLELTAQYLDRWTLSAYHLSMGQFRHVLYYGKPPKSACTAKNGVHAHTQMAGHGWRSTWRVEWTHELGTSKTSVSLENKFDQ